MEKIDFGHYWEGKDLSNKIIVVIYLQSIEERLKAINTASAETQRYCMETMKIHGEGL